MPDPVTAIVGGGSILGTIIGAKSAKKAAGQQADAARGQLDLQRDIFETTEANQAPFIEGGQLALEGLLFELGLGDAPTIGGTSQFNVGERAFDNREEADAFLESERRRFSKVNAGSPQIVANEKDGGFRIVSATPTPATFDTSQFGGVNPFTLQVEDTSTPGTTFGGFQESPGFKFGMQQGINAVDASASASGSLFSGSTLQALNEFGQGFASLGRGTFLDRLAGLVGSGQNATNALASSGSAFAAGGSEALAGLGNAKSAGTIGFGNALTGGLNSLATTLGAFNFGGGGSTKAGSTALKF